jgi:transketolase
MRKTLIQILVELAERDGRILLLTGDLGYLVLEPFSEKFPDQFYNVGVAEQNMVGISVGLAEAGFIPFLYSINPFAALRPYEFIRNGPVLHNLPVRVASIGGGFEYGVGGPSHYGLEDIGVMRMHPALTVIAPADFEQTRSAILATWDLPGPVYYRLGKDDKNAVPGLAGRFKLGRADTVRQGSDIVILAMGSVAIEAHAAAELLAGEDVSCAVVIVASMNPVPTTDLVEILCGYRFAFTVEAHYIAGGLGSLVSEVVAEKGLNCRITRLGVKTAFDGLIGSQNYMRRKHRIDRRAIADTVLKNFKLGT